MNNVLYLYFDLVAYIMNVTLSCNDFWSKSGGFREVLANCFLGKFHNMISITNKVVIIWDW